MICEPCRRDVHIYCPEVARQAAAEGIVQVASELLNGQRCDCQHQPRRERANA